MADNTQNILIKVKAETTKATDDIKRLNKQVSTLEKQLGKNKGNLDSNTKAVKRMGASFQTLGEHLARLVVIYGTFSAITDTVKKFASFEQAMTNLGAISSATGDELKALEAKALELGESTVFSASQVAEAMTEMARAGLTANEQLAGIEGVLNLSINGLVSLQEASIIATTAMNGFGLEAKDIPMIVDVLSKSINTSAQNLSQLGSALAKVAPVAKDMGLSIQETVSTLGTLANAGRRGAEAGTQLKIALLRLGATPEAKKYIDALGISMYEANGKLKPFTEQLRVLKGGLAGLSEEMQKTYKSRIFGTEALASGQIMLDHINEIDLNTKLLNTSFGYAELNAQKMMNTLQGSYKELLSALEGLQIKIGKNLSPALRGLIEDTTTFVRSIDAEAINDFSDAIAGVVKGVVELGRYISATFTIIKDFDNAFGGLGVELVATLALLVKFRQSLIALSTLALANPIIASLALVIGELTLSLIRYQKAIEDMDRSTDRFGSAFYKLSDVITKIQESTDALDPQTARDYLKELVGGAKLAQKEIDRLREEETQLQAKLDDPWEFTSEDEIDRLKRVRENIATLQQEMKNAVVVQEQVTKAGQDAIDTRNKEIETLNKAGATYKLLTKDAQALEGAEQTAHDRMLKRFKDREASLERTLGTMKVKERRFINEIEAMEKELADLRQKNAEARADYEFDYKSNIADLRASALNDLGKYNDAQRRAEAELSLAKRAILEKDFVEAQRHYDEYMRLIQVNATQDIKIGKTVVQTKQQGISELIKDRQSAHDIGLQLLQEEQRKEEQAIQDKISLKKQELDMVKLQIDLQIKSVELMSKLVSELTGIDYSQTFTEFKKRAKEAQDQIDGWLKQQRTLKIDGKFDKSSAEKDINTVVNAGNKAVIAPKIDADIDEAQSHFTKFVHENAGTGIVTVVDTDTDDAQTGFTNFIHKNSETGIVTVVDTDTDDAQKGITKFVVENSKKEVLIPTKISISEIFKQADAVKSKIESTPIVAPANLDTTPALKANAVLRQQLSQPLPDLHQRIFQHVFPARQNGGLIDPIQKFNTGGHARKTGALGGYGGGDKIKALLEAGEFIIKKEAVKALGLSRLYQINQGKLPAYQTGGEVGQPALPRFSTGGNVTKTTSSRTVNVNLNVGGQQFPVVAEEDVANALASYLERSTF